MMRGCVPHTVARSLITADAVGVNGSQGNAPENAIGGNEVHDEHAPQSGAQLPHVSGAEQTPSPQSEHVPQSAGQLRQSSPLHTPSPHPPPPTQRSATQLVPGGQPSTHPPVHTFAVHRSPGAQSNEYSHSTQ